MLLELFFGPFGLDHLKGLEAVSLPFINFAGHLRANFGLIWEQLNRVLALLIVQCGHLTELVLNCLVADIVL